MAAEQRWRDGLARGAWGSIAFCTAAFVIGAAKLARPWPGIGWATATLGFVIGGAFLAGLALTPVAALFVALRRAAGPARLAKAWVGAFVLELGAGAAAADWARHHELRRAAIWLVGAVAVVLLAWALPLWARVARLRGVPQRVLWALPALAPAIVGLALPEDLRARREAPWILVIAAALPYVGALRLPRLALRRGAAAIGLAGTVWLALGFGQRPGQAAALTTRHPPIATVVALARWIGDVDGDGDAGWFGGRDCAPFDPDRSPGGVEIAGNGVDDNCILGDLQSDAAIALPPITTASVPLAGANVLVISVDALRPDKLELYGYQRPTTPSITAAFTGAIVFEYAYSESAATRDTLPSLLTGRRRAELVWHRNGAVALDPSTRTLAHTFAARGHRTIAVLPFVALNMIGATDLGFAQTEIYDERPSSTAERVNTAFLDALDAGEGPFFAFVHYYEPHYPYARHPGFAGVSDDPYDQEIAVVDAAIGRLLTALEHRGLQDNTIIVLTADHGEAFGEHGHYLHNEGVYEEDIRVPWILRVPGVQPRTVAAPVSTTALAATLHELLGWPFPDDAPPTVASVWPLVLEEASVEPPAVVAVARPTLDRERWSLRRGARKLLFDRSLMAFELYDVVKDPGERRDRSAAAPAIADALLVEAAQTLEHVVGAAESRRVRSLGHHTLPPQAIAAGPDWPAGIAGAWAEVTRGVDGSGLPPRVLVHTLVTTDRPISHEVAVVDAAGNEQVVSTPSGPFDPHFALHDDVRTLKVYADTTHRVEIRRGDWRVDLGPVAALPVGPRRGP